MIKEIKDPSGEPIPFDGSLTAPQMKAHLAFHFYGPVFEIHGKDGAHSIWAGNKLVWKLPAA